MGFAEYDRYDATGLCASSYAAATSRHSNSSMKRLRGSSATIRKLNAVVYQAFDEARMAA